MKKPLFRALLVVALVLMATPVLAQARSSVDLKVDGVGTVSAPLQIVLLLTLLSVPAGHPRDDDLVHAESSSSSTF